MISLRYYLDSRRPSRRPDGKYPIKLAVTKRGDTALMPVLAYATREEWDPAAQRFRGRAIGTVAQSNKYLALLMVRCEDVLRDLVLSGEAAPLTAVQIRDRIAAQVLDSGPGETLGEYYDKVAAEKIGSTRTSFVNARRAYEKAAPRIMSRPLVSITEADIAKLDTWIRAHCAPTTRNTYMAKIRQVMKRAHKEGRIPSDVGRDIKLPFVITKDRALTLEQLRLLFSAEPGTQRGREALDLFKLSFYLRAMNGIDIAKASPDDIFNGRLMYVRSKTGKDYSVKVEPEAQAILDKYSDEKHIFAPIAGFYCPARYFQEVNGCLRSLAKGNGLPPVTMYWARHTLASLMIESGESIENTGFTLGHSVGHRITMGYVSVREKQVDDAVRRVFDYVAGETASPGDHPQGSEIS